jgi:hypothetical protein
MPRRSGAGRPGPRRTPSSRWAVTAVSPSPAWVARPMASCRTTAPSSSRPRIAWTSAPPRAARACPCRAGSAQASASATARRRESMPAWTAPAAIAARPASSWLATAARPLTGSLAGAPGVVSAASRSAGDGSTPSSRRRVSWHTATCRRAAGRSPAAARQRTSSSWFPSSRGLRATALDAYATAAAARPPASSPRAAWRSRASITAAIRCRSTTSQDSNAGPVVTPTPSSSSPSSPSSEVGSAGSAASASTSASRPGASPVATGSPPNRPGAARARRSSARVQRSAPSGSSASANSSSARCRRPGGRSASSR